MLLISLINTGIYGYPKAEAAEIAVSTVKAFLDQDDAIETVVFVCFDDEQSLAKMLGDKESVTKNNVLYRISCNKAAVS